MRLVIFLSLFINSGFSQSASDYYNKPIHEIIAKVYQESTFVHTKGYLSCSNGIYNWANKNRTKYKFLSVTPSDSFGIIRLTSIFNCRNIINDTIKKIDTSICNLVITSNSNSLKIGSADNESCQPCGILQRSFIQKELVHLVESLPDSVTIIEKNPYISKGIGDSIYLDSFDRALEKIKVDSIKAADIHRVSDSISKISINSNKSTLDTIKAQQIVDSISAVLGNDSIEERKQAFILFIGQLDLSKQINVITKLECIEFLINNKLRNTTQVQKYLIYLSKLCKTRQDLYYAARLIVNPENKYLCVKHYKKARDEYGMVELCRAKFQ